MSNYYIGLISGTSADGVDAALVEFTQTSQPHLVGFQTTPYDDALKNHLINLNREPTLSLQDLCELNYRLGTAFADAATSLMQATQLKPTDIQAIGSHGQTLYHAPQFHMSLQAGHPAIIAKQTGITTVADFRVDDMANGGQGAPLAPAFHAHLWGQHSQMALVNIGGIANISFLGDTVLGYDTGPGNGLMDEYCQQHFNCDYDQNGTLAAQAEPDSNLLAALWDDPYLALSPPKSTGREHFNRDWLEARLRLFPDVPPLAVLSTLNQFTAETICASLKKLPQPPLSLKVCGGGALNSTLMQRLAALCDCPIESTQADGQDPNAIEAMMFAWLAQQRLATQPIQLSAITGAKQNSVLGAIWHP